MEAIFVGSLLFSLSAQGQIRFNYRYPSQFPQTLLTNIIELEDGYLAVGFAGQDEDIQASPTVMLKIDFFGQVINENSCGGAEFEVSERKYGTQNGDLAYFGSSSLMCSSSTFGIDSLGQGAILFIDLSGDTISSFRFDSPNKGTGFPSDHYVFPRKSVPSADGNLFVLSAINGETTGGDFMVQKRTLDGTLLWTFEFATDESPEYNFVLTSNGEGGVLIMPRIVTGVFPPLQHRLIEIFSSGEYEAHFTTAFDHRTSSLRHAFFDESCIVGACETQMSDPDDMNPGVIKIDSEGDLVFHTPLWENTNTLVDVVQEVHLAPDGNYLAGGYVQTPYEETTDSVGAYHEQAYFSKVHAETGEVLWTRFYSFFDLYGERNRLYDMQVTSDGGAIFCGEATDLLGEDGQTDPPYQQGWIVKVDEHGCLVEGCHVNVDEQGDLATRFFQVGPNPAADFLNIYQRTILGNKAVYQLHDLQGNLIFEGSASAASGTTLMLPTSQWASGVYVLSVKEDGTFLQSEKVIIK